MLAFNDPFFTDEPPYCNTTRHITEEDAILYMRRIHPERLYSNDQALYEFIVVNWAWKVEQPNEHRFDIGT